MSRTSRSSRRTFLKQMTVAGLGATWAISGTKVSGNILGANERIRVGIAGLNGRGGQHLQQFLRRPDVEIAYLIDPDRRVLARRTEELEKLGRAPQCVADVRQALDDQKLDVLSIATCNHWHALMTIWACQAGKDVYVEKPCSHNVFEGRQCVAAARKYDRIVQHGTQSRSSENRAASAEAARSGRYGKLRLVKVYCGRLRWSIGYQEPQEPPTELDYNLWLGPAQQQPYHKNLVHYNWHWFWDTGNGDIGNQGIHELDIARWGIPGATLPKAVVSLGGRWVDGPDWKDQGQTPNMLLSVFDFGETLLICETRGLVRKPAAGPEKPGEYRQKVAVEFYTDAGVIRQGVFYPEGKEEGEPLPGVPAYDATPEHIDNFLDCVRSRKREDLHAEILEGHRSAALAHLANTSYRLGEPVSFQTEPQAYWDNAQVRQSWETIQQNLVAALGVKLDAMTYQLGPRLEFDAAAEKFVGNDAANQLLRRAYREPFVVPETV